MVRKNLIIFLALLWFMPPLIARRSVMPKFQKMSKLISYREEDKKVNSPHSCTLPGCTLYTTSRDGVIDMKRQKRDTGIQYRHEKNKDTTGFIPNYYGIHRASNPNPLSYDTKTNDNELHQ